MTLDRLSGPVVFDIPTDPASLFIVRGLVERLTRRMGFSEEDVGRMVLAVDEACANVIRHAYKDRPDERIVLTFGVHADRLEIGIRDFGPPSDPGKFEGRDLADVKPGGLGIHFMKSAMDEVEFKLPPEGGMLLRMAKHRDHREAADR